MSSCIPAMMRNVYDDVPPSRRRLGVIAIAGVFAFAVIGTAGAFGYRAMFGSHGSKSPPPVIKADATPSKIVPSAAKKDTQQNKLSYDRVGEQQCRREVGVARGAAGRPQRQEAGRRRIAPDSVRRKWPRCSRRSAAAWWRASRRKSTPSSIRPDELTASNPPAVPAAPASEPEQTPAATQARTEVAPPTAPPSRVATPPSRAAAPAPRTQSAPVAERAPEPEPRHVATRSVATRSPSRAASATRSIAPVVRHPRKPQRVTRRSRSARMHRPRHAPPRRPCAPLPSRRRARRRGPPPHGGAHGYAVQLSSQRSEAEAQAAFRGVQAKYPSQLGSRRSLIRKVESGRQGYLLPRHGRPLRQPGRGQQTVRSLKAAGGSCFVQRN